jgi:SAM-dependent methyltransferase
MTQAVDTNIERRRHLRDLWASVAPAWAEHAEYVEQRGAAVTAAMLASTAPQPGERVLELAGGAGDVGLAAAMLVRSGEVVVSDVVAEMTEIAAARAARRDLANVRTRVLDLEAIDEPDASFDVVLCREGLMFATQPARAVEELRRVLHPAGRTAVAVWGPREENPWLAVVFDAVARQLQRPVPPPGIPGPFSLSDARQLRALFEDASFVDVDVTRIDAPVSAPSFDTWWSRTSELAGPLSNVLDAMPDAALDELRERLRATTRRFLAADGSITLPGVTLLLSARAGADGERSEPRG